MAHPAKRSLASAHEAISAYRVSGDLDAAEDAWCDFLHHWVRAINKYDAYGKATFGSAWHPMKGALRRDERLTYLWEARNTDEHSIKPVAGRTPGVALVNPIAVDLDDGLVVGAEGEVGVLLAPGLGLTFSPGNLHTVAIHDRKGRAYPPPIDGGWPVTPLALMEYGLEFLRRAVD
jgi:hypothetical protein